MPELKKADVTRPLHAEVAGPVLLFDGACGLCHRIVRGLLRLDRVGRLRFAALQGAAAQAYLQAHGLPTADFDSLVWVPDWARRDRKDFLLRTDGVIAALRAVGGTGRVGAAMLAVFSAGWRDAGYRGVARWRHRIFGAWLPERPLRPDWAVRFLE